MMSYVCLLRYNLKTKSTNNRMLILDDLVLMILLMQYSPQLFFFFLLETLCKYIVVDLVSHCRRKEIKN